MQNVITYIDGFNLYHGLKSKYGRKFIWLNVEALSYNLLKPGQTLSQVKYFTAMIKNNPPKEIRQKTYISALNTLSLVNIFYGKYLVNPHRCPKCGNVEQIPSEKMTDVNIATHLLTDAFTDQFDVAILITADSDLTGTIETIRNLFPAKKVVVAFPPDRVSFDLKQVASSFIYIGRRKCELSQFPTDVVLIDGTIMHRPSSWQ